MKKNVLLSLALASSVLASAQTITDVYTFGTYNTSSYDTTGVTPGASGANQTWDFSSITPIGTNTSVIGSPNNSIPGASNFPSANMYITTNNDGYAFYNKTSSSMSFIGYYQVSSGVTLSYSDPEIQMQFPFSYGSSFTDNFYTTFVSGGINFVRQGSTTVTADGSGTLIMPFGTSNNVLRVKTEQVYSDSSMAGVVNYHSVNYHYYDPMYAFPIFAISILEADNGFNIQTIKTVSAYDPGTLSIEGLTKNNSFSIYPNPSNGNVFIKTHGLESETFTIYDIAGKLITTVRVDDQNSAVKISLPKGLYFVKSNQSSITQKLVVQ